MQQKITVIVPVYNVENYLGRCIQSIISQTYRNLEIILVDDGSTDNSGNICDEYAKKDGRIRVIHQKNRGLSGARNAGINVATGNYIGFIDSDDWIDSDMFELLLHYANEHNADIVQCDTYINYKNGMEKNNYENLNVRVLDTVQAMKETVYTNTNMSVCNKLFNSFLLKSERFDEELYGIEDWELNYRILKKYSSLVSVYVNAPKYHYFMRTGSITHKWNENAMINSFELFEKIYNCEKNNSEIFPYVCKGYVSHNIPIIKAAILAKKAKNSYFSVMIKNISNKEKILLFHLNSWKSKLRLRIICHGLWLYKIYINLCNLLREK